MEHQLVLLVSLFLVSLCRGQGFCNGNNCPKYKVLYKNEKFETRFYNATEWITTKVDDNKLQDAHRKLKSYVSSQKANGYDIRDDTWPVLITECPNGLSMSWFVPDGTTKPPLSDSSVTFETRPAGIYYVKVFGGIPSLDWGKMNEKELYQALKESKKHFDENIVSAAGYEPYLYFTHHNEILVHATDIINET